MAYGVSPFFARSAIFRTVPDGAWTLPGPIGEALLTMGHVSFWGKGTEVFADTRRAIKLFETSIPPRYYIPIGRRDARLSRAVDVTTYLLPIQRRGCVFQRPRGADDRAGWSLDPSRPDR